MRILGMAHRVEPVVLASTRVMKKWTGLGGMIPYSMSKRKIDGEDVVIMGPRSPVAVVRAGSSAVVGAIHGPGPRNEDDMRVALEGFDVAMIEKWRRSKIRARVSGEMMLFPRGDLEDAAPLPLEKGDLDIYLGKGSRVVKLYPNQSMKLEYHAVCLGAPPASTRPPPADDPADPIEATKALEKEAAKASFAMTMHGKMLVMGASQVAAWEGEPSVHEKGPCPYRETEKVKDVGVVKFEGRDVLAMEPQMAVGFTPRPDGLLLVAWRGASSEPATVITALTIPEDRWKAAGKLTAHEREMVMFDAGVAGRKLEKWDRIEGSLPSTGTYEIHFVDLYGAYVKRAPGGRDAGRDAERDGLEEASISAVRLRKIGR